MEDNLFISWREWLLKYLKLNKFSLRCAWESSITSRKNGWRDWRSNYLKSKLWSGYDDIVFKKEWWHTLLVKLIVSLVFLNDQTLYIGDDRHFVRRESIYQVHICKKYYVTMIIKEIYNVI